MIPRLGPIWLVGAGNMGGAMLRRWIAAGLDPSDVTVITRTEPDVPAGVRALRAPPPDAEPAIMVLAVKPQQLDVVAPTYAHLKPPLLVSILAGVEEQALAARIPAGAVVRAMPNLPVEIGRGVVALFSRSADPAGRVDVERLMAPLGLVEWMEEEAAFGAVTALAGCGPAFLFRFVDALSHAGEKQGLPKDQAARLAAATVAGAADMVMRASLPPAALADQVASPGGSTREGLNILDADDALKRLLAATLDASARRNEEMAAAARG